ncbi:MULTISPECIES: hypothetical protein [unclassified Blastococcus]
MRRALTRSAAVVAVAVGALLPAGPAAADGPLMPGQTQALSVELEPGTWDQVPDLVTVQVTRLLQLEKGCLEPEDAAGDRSCDPEQGELAGQLQATVTPGVIRDEACEAIGLPRGLDLLASGPVELAVATPADWDRVTCLHLALTFRDLPENNRAQSDEVVVDLRVLARDLPGGPADGGDGATVEVPVGTPAGSPPAAGAAGGPVGDAVAGAPAAGAPAAAGGGAGAPAAAPDGAVGGPVAPATGGPEGEVVGRSDASVTVGGDGAAVRTQAAGTSLLGTALVWSGVLLAALALFWALFLLLRRRRRTERPA